jgi:hypothetical protein
MTEILNKDDFIIIKNEKNKYSATIAIRERKIDVMRLFQFDKLHILKELNTDIIEKLEIMHSSNEGCATILILYKHFFRELGFPQFGICLDVIRVERENLIEFVSSNNSSVKHDNSDYVILPIDTLFMKIFQENSDFYKITLDTIINVNFDISPTVEKLVLQLVSKIFTRVKQFIEN